MEIFSSTFLTESIKTIEKIDVSSIEKAVDILAKTKSSGGRLFILGVGGSAGSASHAVNDFRKIAGFEAYCPTDNVSELTARTNDDGWDSVFLEWLKGSRLNKNDSLLILSVGGGNLEKNVSVNLIKAIDYAKTVDAKIIGIVGRDGGYCAKNSDISVLIPVINTNHITPHTESFHGVIWHLMVSHPKLKTSITKWESVTK